MLQVACLVPCLKPPSSPHRDPETQGVSEDTPSERDSSNSECLSWLLMAPRCLDHRVQSEVEGSHLPFLSWELICRKNLTDQQPSTLTTTEHFLFESMVIFKSEKRILLLSQS